VLAINSHIKSNFIFTGIQALYFKGEGKDGDLRGFLCLSLNKNAHENICVRDSLLFCGQIIGLALET
jgi:hypothetical protein